MQNLQKILLILIDKKTTILPYECLDDSPTFDTLEKIVGSLLNLPPEINNFSSKNIIDYDFLSWDLNPMDESIKINKIPFPKIAIIVRKKTKLPSKVLAHFTKMQIESKEGNIKATIDRHIEQCKKER